MMNLNGLTKIFTGNGGTIRFAIAGVTILGIVGTVVNIIMESQEDLVMADFSRFIH